ncbi:MAG: hypothetical protein FRX49_11682 [Trebouxia sp. A1-2]|nr:MAG: hypothetical protein FRX49_11682 [Trebouxia sp. A1-2]
MAILVFQSQDGSESPVFSSQPPSLSSINSSLLCQAWMEGCVCGVSSVKTGVGSQRERDRTKPALYRWDARPRFAQK